MLRVRPKAVRGLPIPFSRPCRSRLYDPRDVEAYLQDNRSAPIGALERALRDYPVQKQPTRGPSSTVETVYFIRSGSRIKIGASRNVAKRMAALQTASANRLQLLGTCPGGKAMEFEFHKQWHGQKLEGEWFRSSPELLRFIAELQP